MDGVVRPKENKAHRVTNINVMRAAAKIFIFDKYAEINIIENSTFIFLGQNRVDELPNMKYATIRYHSYKCTRGLMVLKNIHQILRALKLSWKNKFLTIL